MENVQFRLNDQGKGHFFIMEGGKEIAVMEIGLTAAGVTVYHTEVVPEAEGRGLGRQLLNSMVAYVRNNHLKVVKIFCIYAHGQFKKHWEEYADIWEREK